MKSPSFKIKNIEEIEINQNQILPSRLVTQNITDPMANHSTKNAYPTLLADEANQPQFTLDSKPPLPIETIESLIEKSKRQNSIKQTDKQLVEVESRIVILKVGQIDTRNERYDAEAYIECSWHDDELLVALAGFNDSNTSTVTNSNGNNSEQQQQVMPHNPFVSSNNNNNIRYTQSTPATIITNSAQQTNLQNLNLLKQILHNIHTFEYDSNLHWSPQLYIENAIGDIKEEIRYKLEIVEKKLNERQSQIQQVNTNNINKYMSNITVRVCEMRKLRGVFYERLELYDFPMDIQELSITLTSKRSNQEVLIVENTENPCSINTEDFLDQQEWDLFSHVKTSTKIINDQWRKYDRSGYSVTAFIARKPGYYLYNAYMLIFLITVLGFVPFAFDPAAPQFRAQVTGLLLLTSVNFRWIVTQRLPSVPYLTSLDKYAIGSLLFLVFFCVWHSLIGSNMITSTNKKNIDTYILYGLAALYIFYNLFYVIWFLKMSRMIRKFKERCQVKQMDLPMQPMHRQSIVKTNNNDTNLFIKNEKNSNLHKQISNNNVNNNGNSNGLANGGLTNPNSNGFLTNNHQSNTNMNANGKNASKEHKNRSKFKEGLVAKDPSLLLTSA